jgi:hypothetical protein
MSFSVLKILILHKIVTWGRITKNAPLLYTNYSVIRVKFLHFYITSIFSASRGIFSASRGDLVRISLNFSTFNILIYRGFRKKCLNGSIMSIHYFEPFRHFFKPPIPLLQTTKRRLFLIINIICLFDVIFQQ